MATLEPVPEAADRGFWYVVPEVLKVLRPTGETTVDENGDTVDVYAWQIAEPLPGEATRRTVALTGQGWTATYIGDGTAVVRSPVPLVGVDALPESSAAKLIAAGEATRPFGRIRGR